MGSKHLTDEEIQGFLDERSVDCSAEIANHLDICPECHTRAEQYSRLNVGLSDESGFELPVDFTSTILNSIVAEMKAPFWQRHFESLVAAAGLLMTLAAVAYFVDLTAVAKSLMRIDLFRPFHDNAVAADMKTRLASSTRFAIPLVSGLLAIAAVWVVDRLMIRSKRGISSLLA
ncbi:MAG: hypothetical protein KKG33_02975 [candidate division Zixibacteria bacterium]|nr:hypothetical protein [candidate division Zixibacteria bacterium]MBU1470735.1 hypothetical protein [candidate division Zixibacteria bacterium]MBU2624505.1 hypothetical protein [candidate division Zixibacteria bacterium]